MTLLGVWENQQALTELVKRDMARRAEQNDGGEQRRRVGEVIAPLVPVNDTVTSVRTLDLPPAGIGQFRAPDASPALYKPKPRITERMIELLFLDEKERFVASEWQKLQSPDEELAKRAKINLVERLQIFMNRNDNLTEKMRWDAFKGGVVTITYPTGAQIVIDYGFPAGHTPTAATAWTDTVNSDPIADLRAWAGVGATDAGAFYNKIHLTSDTWLLLQNNSKIKNYLSALGRDLLIPNISDVQRLLREGTGNFVFADGGWQPDSATNYTLTKFLPNNRLLLTTDYVFEGQRIADVADGLVPVLEEGAETPTFQRGIQTEVYTERETKTVFRRVSSSRVVRIHLPQNFLYATVGA